MACLAARRGLTVRVLACGRDRRGISSMEYGLLGAIVVVALASVTDQYATLLLPIFDRLVTFAAAL
jgi:Flp pilus assembly pilin Flp